MKTITTRKELLFADTANQYWGVRPDDIKYDSDHDAYLKCPLCERTWYINESDILKKEIAEKNDTPHTVTYSDLVGISNGMKVEVIEVEQGWFKSKQTVLKDGYISLVIYPVKGDKIFIDGIGYLVLQRDLYLSKEIGKQTMTLFVRKP